jgi:hypothetical protein
LLPTTTLYFSKKKMTEQEMKAEVPPQQTEEALADKKADKEAKKEAAKNEKAARDAKKAERLA